MNDVEQFAKAGADIITFHIEATDDVVGTIELIKKFNVKKIYVSFIGEIDFLKGRDKIANDVQVDVLMHL